MLIEDSRDAAALIEARRHERGIGVAELARRIGVDGKRLWYVSRESSSKDCHTSLASAMRNRRYSLPVSGSGEPGRADVVRGEPVLDDTFDRAVVLDDLLAAIGELFLHVVGKLVMPVLNMGTCMMACPL